MNSEEEFVLEMKELNIFIETVKILLNSIKERRLGDDFYLLNFNLEDITVNRVESISLLTRSDIEKSLKIIERFLKTKSPISLIGKITNSLFIGESFFYRQNNRSIVLSFQVTSTFETEFNLFLSSGYYSALLDRCSYIHLKLATESKKPIVLYEQKFGK